MLLDEFKFRDQYESNTAAGTSSLQTFLETTSNSGHTAVQLACWFQSCAIIELLVESKSNLEALDKEGNTAIMIAASRPIVIMEIPTKEFSPSIFKVNFHLKSYYCQFLNAFKFRTDLQR